MRNKKIQWHPGFVAAINLEFAANRDHLIYEKEYNLNIKPLEIDLLVIKKDKHARIQNEIGKIFRGHNIMEFKSVQDHLDIDTFYKTGAYASLYNRMDKQSMREFLEEIHNLEGKYNRELADAILEVSTKANQKVVEELRGDESMCQTLLEIMEPEINEIVEMRVNTEVKSKINLAIKSLIKSFQDMGANNEIITNVLIKNYGFTTKEAELYLKNL